MSLQRALRVDASREGHRVTTFELVFDLVFVFAFTQVSALVVHAHDARGVLQGLVVLGLLWWSWVAYSWLANQAPADRGLLVVAMSAATTLMFVVALTIPEAFHDAPGGLHGPLVLVVAYALVRALHIVVYVAAAGDDRALRRQVLATLVVALVPSLALLLVGVAVGEPAQTWIWLAAWLLDVAVVYGTSRGGSWRLNSAAHWAERYGLIVILALGESVVAIGAGVAQEPVSWPILLGSVLAVGGTLELWWAYFRHLAPTTEHALAARSGIDRVATATLGYTYLHFPMVAGVILGAVGTEQVMAHIGSSDALGLFGAAALGGGVALYLAATVLFMLRLTGHLLVVRLALAVLLLPGVALLAVLPALPGFAVVVLVVALALGLETRTFEPGQRPRPVSPGR